MHSDMRMPYALLVSIPGIDDLENMHMISALNMLDDEFQPLESHTPDSSGETTMTRMIRTARGLTVPAAIFTCFFALPMFTYAAIVA